MSFNSSISHTKIQQGDVKEFEKLFQTYYEALCYYAFGIINDMDEAEEIVQNLFVSYWKKRRKINIRTTAQAYLYQATRNSSLKHIRHRKVRRKYEQHLALEQNYEQSVQQSLEAKQLHQIISEAIESLPERSRIIFKLSRFEGLKYKEIAEELAISIKTVEAHMGIALKHIRAKLNELQ